MIPVGDDDRSVDKPAPEYREFDPESDEFPGRGWFAFLGETDDQDERGPGHPIYLVSDPPAEGPRATSGPPYRDYLSGTDADQQPQQKPVPVTDKPYGNTAAGYVPFAVVMPLRDGTWQAVIEGENTVLAEYESRRKEDVIAWSRRKCGYCLVYSEATNDFDLVTAEDSAEAGFDSPGLQHQIPAMPPRGTGQAYGHTDSGFVPYAIVRPNGDGTWRAMIVGEHDSLGDYDSGPKADVIAWAQDRCIHTLVESVEPGEFELLITE